MVMVLSVAVMMTVIAVAVRTILTLAGMVTMITTFNDCHLLFRIDFLFANRML